MANPIGFWDGATSGKKEFTQNLMNTGLLQYDTKANLDAITQLLGMMGFETDGGRLLRSNGTLLQALELIGVGTDSSKPAGAAANDGKQYYATDSKTLYYVQGGALNTVSIVPKYDNRVGSGSHDIINSTTFETITGLAFPLETSQQYFCIVNIFWASNATADIKFRFKVPAGTGGAYSVIEKNTSDVLTKVASVDITGVVAFGGTAGNVLTTFFVYVTVGGTAGNLEVEFAQNVADAGTTSVSDSAQGTNIIGSKIIQA